MTRKLPPSASVATPMTGAKLHAPAAARNAEAIAEFLQAHAPNAGQALEIASGTGQHVMTFAAAMPRMAWQPTDVDEQRLTSIDSYVQDAGLHNVRPARILDAAQAGWGATHAGKDLIVLINLLHLIPEVSTKIILQEAAVALSENGVFILYGPFKRNGTLTSDGDLRFDAELRGADPAIGYKDTRDIQRWFADVGLNATAHEMPANNLAFVARKPAP